MRKIYPSRFALPQGTTLDARWPASCPRYGAIEAYVKEHCPEALGRSEIDPLYQAIGALGEARVIALLQDAGEIVQREVPVVREVAVNVVISGRIDVITGIAEYRTFHEIKTTTSEWKLKTEIKSGTVNVNFLGQLVTYMVLERVPRGRVHLQHVVWNDDLSALVFDAERTYVIDLDHDTGRLQVDGEDYPYDAVRLMRYHQIMVAALTSEALPPATADLRACQTCPFQKICDSSPKDWADVHRLINQGLISKPSAVGRAAEIKRVKAKRGKK